jgi:hypothetical protein
VPQNVSRGSHYVRNAVIAINMRYDRIHSFTSGAIPIDFNPEVSRRAERASDRDWVQQEVDPVAILGVHASEWRLHRSPRRHLPPTLHIHLPSIIAPRPLDLEIQHREDGQMIVGKFPVNVFYIRRSLMVSLTVPIDRTASTTPTGSIATTRPEVLPATDVEQTHPRTPIT